MSFEASTKSAEAFRTISEVADELDLPQHVLRFWETRFPQVHPLKRAGNRRYYRPEDMDLLRGIHRLLYGEGLTIRGVQKILKEQGLRYVAELGRGETDFMTPLKRAHARDLMRVPEALAKLHLEFGQPAEAIEPLRLVDSDQGERPGNVHSFPGRAEPEGDARRALAPEERIRLETLLADLLELKARLTAAKSRLVTADARAA